MDEWVSCPPLLTKAEAEAALDVRCARHDRMSYCPETGPLIEFVMTDCYDSPSREETRSVLIRPRWVCHGFDGEGCWSFIWHEQALLLAARGGQSPGVSAVFRQPERPAWLGDGAECPRGYTTAQL